MPILIQVTNADGERREVQADAGTTLAVVPGDTVLLPNIDPENVTVDVRDGNLVLEVADEGEFAFADFAAHLEAGRPVAMLIGQDGDRAIIDSVASMEAAARGDFETAAAPADAGGITNDGSVTVDPLETGARYDAVNSEAPPDAGLAPMPGFDAFPDLPVLPGDLVADDDDGGEVLTGTPGMDVFTLEAENGAEGVDTIIDFEPGTDVLDISDLLTGPDDDYRLSIDGGDTDVEITREAGAPDPVYFTVATVVGAELDDSDIQTLA